VKEIAKKVNLLEPLGVDNIAIKPDYYFSGAYIIDLPLDSTPDHVWQDIFEIKWKSSRQLWDRKLFVIGNKLRLVSTPNEIGSKLDWIKQVLEQTNKGIDEYNREAEASTILIERQKEKQRLEDEAGIERIRSMIRSSLAH
jgi:hypothetical protein